MVDLNALTAWYQSRGLLLAAPGVRLEHRPPSVGLPTNSTGVTVETPRHVGRATLWDSGLCDLEALDADTGATTVREHHAFAEAADAVAAINSFVVGLLTET